MYPEEQLSLFNEAETEAKLSAPEPKISVIPHSIASPSVVAPVTAPKGAKASAIVYSLIETAEANDLDPERYLKYLFEKLPNTANFKDAETLDQYLPWATKPQEKCKG